jgi:exodeoxyribonuclease VII small subunit
MNTEKPTMNTEERKYEEALTQLETIVHKMEGGEYDIDELAKQLKTAQQIIKFCNDKLTKTEAELAKIMSAQTEA